MKASEMTNERIAEAAARLLKSEERVSKQKSINKELVDDVDDLRSRLKVAEDALYDFVNYAENHAPLEAGLNPIIDKARAAIRNEAAVNQPVTNCNHLGNAERMREALKKAQMVLSRISQSAWFIDANFSETKEVMDAGNAITAALTASPRNCDRFSNARDALEAFENETGETMIEFIRWLFA